MYNILFLVLLSFRFIRSLLRLNGACLQYASHPCECDVDSVERVWRLAAAGCCCFQCLYARTVNREFIVIAWRSLACRASCRCAWLSCIAFAMCVQQSQRGLPFVVGAIHGSAGTHSARMHLAQRNKGMCIYIIYTSSLNARP